MGTPKGNDTDVAQATEQIADAEQCDNCPTPAATEE